MTDMRGIFPVAIVALLVVGRRLLGLYAPASPIDLTGRLENEPRRPAIRPLTFSPILVALWALFLICVVELAKGDPFYALSLVITAASSCKLRRVYSSPSNTAHRTA
jgi:hypothetical protein